MALFKIEKGLAANLATNRPNSVEGYCYFTSDDGKFYIDIATGTALTPAENGGKLAGATRMPINSYLSDWAVRAYADRNGNDITCTYGNRLSLSDKYTLKLIASDSTELGIITLPKDVDTASKFTSAQTIELTGAVTGSASSQAGWEIPTTLSDNSVITSKISNNAVTNEKLANSSITIGGKVVNLGGVLTLADIGLNTALRFIGTTSTAITDGSTTPSIIINGSNVTPTIGDVIINKNNSQEYVWLGSAWELLGDESSYALKTITISGSNGLTGSGTLSGNITLSHADTSNQASISASGRRYITGVTLDTYGHVTGLTTGTETVTDTHYTTKLFATGSSGTAHDVTTNGNTYLRLFDNNTARQSIKIIGSGATSVSSDANGVITISSTDNNTTYDSMSINEGTTGTETINRVLNAANLKEIINTHAPTKTGTGASGTWGINITGNAATATKFDTATNVTLTGDITGSSSSQKGWNIKTTIGEGKVTNAMLAGSISNDKLANSYFTIKEGSIDHNISLGGQVLSKDLATWLGLSKIMSFVGISDDTNLVNGYTGTPTIKEGQTNYTTKTPGDTVLHETTGKQFIWTGSSWYEIGNGLLYDLQGTAAGLIATLDVNDIDGGTNNFVSTVKQTDGKINVTHKALVTTGKWAGEAGSVAWENVTGKPSTFTPSEHTHNYAGSASAGGSANSAVKLDTTTAGSSTQPVYFSGGKPVAITGAISNSTTGNAATATKLQTARTISLTGAITGSGTFDGTTDISINTTLNGSHTHDQYLPLTAGKDKKLTGPLGLTANINYGPVLPTDTFNGQLFFLEDSGAVLPPGGTAGQVLVKNSAADNDASWATDIAGNAATATALTSNAGSSTQPIYFSEGKPIATSNNLNININGAIGENQLDKINIIDYVNNSANIHKTTLQGEMNLWRFFAKGDESNYSTLYNLPCVDSHNLVFSIDKNSDWIRIFSLDMRNSNIYTRAKTGGNWADWKKVWVEGNSVTGAVWNDYAECRESNCEEFGYVLMETGDDSLTKTTERLSHFAGVSSDTWGFSQGETARARTPIAVAGRVLVYPYQDRNNYKPGDCVCAAPGGTVDIMTREEVREWPDRIVGTVSCVPDYEEWGGGEGADRDPIKVDGRIWIKVK